VLGLVLKFLDTPDIFLIESISVNKCALVKSLIFWILAAVLRPALFSCLRFEIVIVET
jgi:hypothetical protein